MIMTVNAVPWAKRWRIYLFESKFKIKLYDLSIVNIRSYVYIPGTTYLHIFLHIRVYINIY